MLCPRWDSNGPPPQTHGFPGNMRNPTRSCTSTIRSEAQNMHNVHTPKMASSGHCGLTPQAGVSGVQRFDSTSPASSPLTSLLTVVSLFDNRRGRPSAPSSVEDTDVPCQVADAFGELRGPGYAP